MPVNHVLRFAKTRWMMGKNPTHRQTLPLGGVCVNRTSMHRWTIPEDTLSLVRELARFMPDRQIARLLNRAGKPTGRGNGWTQARVRSFRSHHGIAVHRPDEWAERGEITLQAAAQIIVVSEMTALRMDRRAIVKGRQICLG